MTLDSDNTGIRFMRIFAGVSWKGVVIQQWGNRKRFFLAFGRYVFGTLGNGSDCSGIPLSGHVIASDMCDDCDLKREIRNMH